MIEVRQSAEFSAWLSGLRDRRALARIVMRIDRLGQGHVGDAKYFDGSGELRIDDGPGYRVYFVTRGSTVFILLCGDDKSSQKRDIQRAKALAQQV